MCRNLLSSNKSLKDRTFNNRSRLSKKPPLSKASTISNILSSILNYTNDALTEYFKKNALIISPQTILEKSFANDYEYFLSQGNFLKVVDTLEKFQEGLVDTNTEAGKNFVQFKRQLYKLYEVRHRSMLEHEAFSFKVERRNLKQLYKANVEYVDEVARYN